ncbi:MAG: alpha-galactosidase [Capsulimonadaceae bacterium]|nr:alpha-galactosidase [Capsulimonadaceae bacterium]
MSFLSELIAHTGAAEATDRFPFSFVYDGCASADFLPDWVQHTETVPLTPRGQCTASTLTDPATGLAVRVETTRFPDSQAVEWVLKITMTGASDTPVIEKIRPLDLGIKAPTGNVVLRHAHGSTCTATDFLPIDTSLSPGGHIDVAPHGGRSSNGALPFFNLEYAGGGLVCAIGWSGQWSLHVERDGESGILLNAGQQTVQLKLHPGEEIRTPRMLLVPWSGRDRYAGHNALRRLLIEHYLPRIDGEIVQTPIAANTWFTFNQGNEVTEENQKVAIADFAKSGIEYFWLDAGWFEGGWPSGAGSWVPKKEAFPRGLRPLADDAHAKGMKFVLWFEPERVTSQSLIAHDHPEWVLHCANEKVDALFDLGNPAAREWLTDYLAKCLIDWDVDVFRNDFNIDPLPWWQATDTPDRAGITEIRYVEGLYAMWDELRRRKPGLTIDNCASGGRRIDLETISRSYPLWQSDTQCCGHDEPVQNQVQNAGLSLYVPQHTAGAWGLDKYNVRSVATSGYALSSDIAKSDELSALVRKATAEVKALRPYYLGDYYPLLPITLDSSAWCGWQFHRDDLRGGFVMLFRRGESPYTNADVKLHGLAKASQYALTDCDTGKTWDESGQALASGIAFEMAERASTRLIRYEAR